MLYIFYQLAITAKQVAFKHRTSKKKKSSIAQKSVGSWSCWAHTCICGQPWLGSVALLILAGLSQVFRGRSATGWYTMAWDRRAGRPSMLSFIKPRLVHMLGRKDRCKPCLLRPWRGTHWHIRCILYWPKHVIRPAPIQDMGKQSPTFDVRAAKLPCEGHGYKEGKELGILL